MLDVNYTVSKIENRIKAGWSKSQENDIQENIAQENSGKWNKIRIWEHPKKSKLVIDLTEEDGNIQELGESQDEVYSAISNLRTPNHLLFSLMVYHLCRFFNHPTCEIWISPVSSSTSKSQTCSAAFCSFDLPLLLGVTFAAAFGWTCLISSSKWLSSAAAAAIALALLLLVAV